jgi:hypothetical protein
LTEKEIPTPDSLFKDEAYIEKQGFWDGFEVWLKRKIVGQVVLAVVFVGSVTAGLEAINKYGTIIYTNKEHIIQYVNNFGHYAADQARGFLVHSEKPPTDEDKKHQDQVFFSTGSLVYPVTGKWSPT